MLRLRLQKRSCLTKGGHSISKEGIGEGKSMEDGKDVVN